ncbi:MAG: RNA-binding S4 domain-containing protein [Lentimicrobium sp.]|jgi:ribosome-associated heat shock protein Hsp15|nr:RNA-binding S4 domain-containing protein [Lentimicrobium sp.]
MAEELRVDKWLWAVRIYKTRTMAGDACRAGKVKMEGLAIKPSRILKTGDVLMVSQGPLTRTLRVKALIHNRVSAKLVPDSLEDLTPAEEYERIKFMHELNAEHRDRGTGRPTKKERRLIDRLKEPDEL